MKTNPDKKQTGFEKYPKLYGSKAWRQLRLNVKDRDGWLCQECLRAGKEKMVESGDPVHHKKPHNGNRDIFFDIDNLESVCQNCHDSSVKIF
jgi:5-methylcytosine-specific restriction protein A